MSIFDNKIKTIALSFVIAIATILCVLVIIRITFRQEKYITITDSTDILTFPKTKIEIDHMRIFNNVRDSLAKDSISSDVFSFNNMQNDTYKYQNQDFYNIITTAKEIAMCYGNKKISPIKCNDYLNSLLINNNITRKLNPTLQIDLDDFIDTCVLTKITSILTQQEIKNYCAKYGNEIYVNGNQNNNTRGWNITKSFKYNTKTIKIVQQEKTNKPKLIIPYNVNLYGEIKNNISFLDKIKTTFNDHTVAYKNTNSHIGKNICIKLLNIKNKSICFISENNNIFCGVVISDNPFLSHAVANVYQQGDFMYIDDISSRLRYHDCQYFLLYRDKDDSEQYRKSFGLKVEKKNNYYAISCYAE